MKRVVVKVGTHVLSAQNRLSKERILNLVEFLVALMEKYEVILVSSGAVAAGYSILKLDKKLLHNRQAIAAVGQPQLMSTYNKKLERFGKSGAQLLLTADDFDSRKRCYHAKCTIDTLLENGILPIINENDATATEELVFGDNDQLSSRVAYYFGADLLILLSDIDGYYDKDPHKYEDAKMRKIVHEIEPSELEMEKSANFAFATGGIVTKLKAAQFLLEHQKSMFIASGFDLSDVKSYMLEGVHKGGTLFTCKNR
ncbi:glutamate 5-kinase [Sulfurospirillum deleyianum]|uniref:Glutamate 5-kinase n=1 Tax=Sulfurospirillum deleyianum (strain ATCC 51133 / DSM 6946 / 5175) TaxID=525898 RepID=D1AZS5_SULD5|nr:glutamate 5-kinase [Sulfurospirillum deleyianum]ACZ11542.1 glutamate 5-kinase [Sulfurospirillum deleyianum DSM 6946]